MPPLARQRRPVPPAIQSVHLPAPVGGLNALDAASAMPPSDCVSLWNMVAAEYGLRSRLGWREWCTTLTGASDNLVRSILPFAGSAAAGAQDKLFATTSSGIWDVTASSTSPSLVQAFGTTTGDAGYGNSRVVVTSAGHFLLYCDEVNGLYIYSQGSGTWSKPTMGAGAGQIANVDPANLVFVTVFKGRVWFVERDTAKSWYLAAGSVTGAATQFDMGAQFRAGGPLIGLWSWTTDGGLGIDDNLVAVSGAGDVVIWQGTDPASASTFGLRGVWYVGGLPAGRNIATNFGGDLALLTRTGIQPLSILLSGNPDSGQYPTNKILNLFNALMLSRSSLKGWSLRLHPEDNALMVTVPTAAATATEQLVMSLAKRSWSRYRDLPMYCNEIFGGKLYFGTTDGRVCINDGYVDGVLLSDANAYSPVQWAVLTAFQNLGNGRQKQVQLIRPTLLSDGAAPSYGAAARYRYDFSELATVAPGSSSGATWNSATWDHSVWGGDYAPTQSLTGAAGMGVDVAIALRGTAQARTVLVGMDVMFTQGGLV